MNNQDKQINFIDKLMKTSCLKSIITACLVFASIYMCRAQSLVVTSVDASAYPLVKSQFYAFDTEGRLVKNFSRDEIIVTESGISRNVVSVDCRQESTPEPVSALLLLDISCSMCGEPIELVKTSAKAWLDIFPLGLSDCALASFSDETFINQDYTTNKSSLAAAINNIKCGNGTDFDRAFNDPVTGAFALAANARHRKIIIFISDGHPNKDPRTDLITQKAAALGITIYCLSVNGPSPVYMNDFSSQTGGMSFENIVDSQGSQTAFNIILAKSTSSLPCELYWESMTDCDDIHSAVVTVMNNNASDTVQYSAPEQSRARLEVSPLSVRFYDIYPGQSKDTIITVSALNADFDVLDIKSSSTGFEASPRSFLLKRGESRDVSLRLSPYDSSTIYARIEIITSLCNKSFSAVNLIKQDVQPANNLCIHNPDGGEIYFAGHDTTINWENIEPEDSVRLEFSTNNGLSWNIITNSTTGLSYRWKPLPQMAGDQCLLRIRQVARSVNADSNKPKCIYTMTGHRQFVTSAAWSPNGKMIASGGYDSTIKIWNAGNGDLVQTLRGHNDIIASVAWSPDGRLIASGGYDNTIRLWDATTGDCLDTLRGHTESVHSICFSPDGKNIASGSYDFTIKTWETASGQCLKTLNGDNFAICAVAYSPDGLKIASGSGDKTIKIWDATTGLCLDTLSAHNTGGVWSVAFSPEGKRLVSASCDSTLRIWDLDTGLCLDTLTGHKDVVWSVAFSPDGQTIASASGDRTIRRWDALTGRCLDTLTGHGYFVCSLAYSPDGRRLVSTSYDFSVKVWSLNNYELTLQEDVSDSVWSIVKINLASVPEIDMHEVLVGSSRDSLVKSLIANLSDYPSEILSFKLSGANASSFAVNSSAAPISIEARKSRDVEINFSPLAPGPQQAELTITTPDTVFVIILRGEGISGQLKTLAKTINFGSIWLCDEKDTTAFLIKNISGSDALIDSVVITGPETTQYNIISGGGAFILKPGESRELRLGFKPNAVGRSSSSVSFFYQSPCSPLRLSLFGEGVGTSISCSSDSAYPGQIKTLFINISGTSGRCYNDIIQSYKARLKFQASVMAPVDRNLEQSIAGDTNYINLTGGFNSSGVLDQFDVIAGLGSVETSTIDFDYIKWFDAGGKEIEMDSYIESGSFRALGLCREGGNRLLNPSGKEEIRQVLPNPANDEISIGITLTEKSMTHIYLTNILGANVSDILNTNSPLTGNSEIIANISGLSPGMYFLVLETRNGCQSIKVSVYR